MKKRVAVLISGSGSNLQALIDAATQTDYPARIVVVISNRADAYGLQRAQQAGIACEILPHTEFATRREYDAALHQLLLSYNVELVCLAGFMRILGAEIVQKWQGRMLNIHPSLLPDYKGLNTHARALADGADEAGCTVHFVTAELDDGPIIAQARVPVLPDDDEARLAARVLEQEHRLYPQALRAVASGACRLL